MIELSRLKFVFCLLETNCSYIIKQDNYYLENQMARFKTMKKNGETIYVNIDNNTGDFYCKITKFALEYMDEIRNSKWKNNLDVKNNEWCVITKTFDDLNAFLNSLNVYLAPKLRSYPVIQYAINEQVAYCTNSKGNIYPTGININDYQWHGTLFEKQHNYLRENRDGYSIGIYAKALLRTDEYIIDDNGNEKIIKTKYELYYDKENGGSHLNQKTAAARLNSWKHMDLVGDSKKNIVEIPYSEETADFFYQSIYNLVLQSIKIKQFFANEQVVKSLETGNIFHLRNPDMLVLMKKD